MPTVPSSGLKSNFQKAELQHAFSTRIKELIWINPCTNGKFSTLIPMQLIVLRNSLVLRYFFHLQDLEEFYQLFCRGKVLLAQNCRKRSTFDAK